MNTAEILQHMVDPETDKILKDVFGNVCPAFLENRCDYKECPRAHCLADTSTVRASLIYAPPKALSSVFAVALRFFRLFHAYVTIFTDIFANNGYLEGMQYIVEGCCRDPRTVECLKDFVRKIVDLDFWKVHKAIRFVICYHKDCEFSREVILQMILDSGPCLPYFMDYIEYVYEKQLIRVDVFDRILHACVAYQNPKLPNFCLNYLQQCNIDNMHQLNKENLMAFVQMNRCFSELNETRESKLLAVLKKIQQ